MTDSTTDDMSLPKNAIDFIDTVVKKVRYRKRIRHEVRAELTDHFYMALKDCDTQDRRQQDAEKIISEFGDINQLACLIRRGKKRCRSFWKMVLARICLMIVLSIGFMIFYFVWFLLGHPAPSVDYLAIINERAHSLGDSENAWPYYEEAVALYVDPNDDLNGFHTSLRRNPAIILADLSVDESEALYTWIRQNEPAWQEFVAASNKPYSFREYSYSNLTSQDEQWLMNILLPHLGDIKDIATVGLIRSKLALERGDNKEALENCYTLLKVSAHLQAHSFLIESLVGMSIANYGVQQVMQVVGKGGLMSEELAEARQNMAAVYAKGYPYIDYSGERLFTMDAIQHYFTDGGPGGGHMAPFAMMKAMQSSEMDASYIGKSFIHAGRDKTVEKVDEMYQWFAKLTLMSPHEQKIKAVSFEDPLNELSVNRYMLLHTIFPALRRVTRSRFEIAARYEAALTVFAIKQWQAEKGALPENLDVLVEAGLLKELPDDPYAAGPLVYRVDGGDFVLYSVSRNFIDDDGVAEYGANGTKKKWGEDADYVFWPVFKK